MPRLAALVFLIGLPTATAMASDCPYFGYDLGAPLADLNTPGHFEPGNPKSITIKGAKVYRALHPEGGTLKFKEFVAVRDGLLVALVQEFAPENPVKILSTLQAQLG